MRKIINYPYDKLQMYDNMAHPRQYLDPEETQEIRGNVIDPNYQVENISKVYKKFSHGSHWFNHSLFIDEQCQAYTFH